MTYFIAPNPYRMARRWAHMAGFEPSHDFNLSVDVREEDEAYILNALVPGLKAEDLNIQVLDDVVTITGEFKAGRVRVPDARTAARLLPPDPAPAGRPGRQQGRSPHHRRRADPAPGQGRIRPAAHHQGCRQSKTIRTNILLLQYQSARKGALIL